MALGFLNRCGFRAASAGTGSFVVNSALTGFQVPEDAAGPTVVNAGTYRYFAESDDKTEWEIGYGVYTTADDTLTRATVLDNSSGGTSALNFAAAPKVFMGGPLAQDMTHETIAAFNFATTPAASFSAAIDFSKYGEVHLLLNGIRVDLTALAVDDSVDGFMMSVDNAASSEILASSELGFTSTNASKYDDLGDHTVEEVFVPQPIQLNCAFGFLQLWKKHSAIVTLEDEAPTGMTDALPSTLADQFIFSLSENTRNVILNFTPLINGTDPIDMVAGTATFVGIRVS